MKNRKYTDSQLRRLFPNNAEYQAARVKDIEGIDPLTNQDYQDQELDRRETQSRIDARDRGAEDPAQIIKDARAQAEAMAEASGLSPDDPDYNDYILDTISEITKIPRYTKPIPRLTDAEANALYEKGEIDADYEYINEKGERVKYVPEEKAVESEGKKDPRSRAAEARKNR